MDRTPDGFFRGPDGKVRPRHDPKEKEGGGGVVALAIGLAVVVGGGGVAGVEGASTLNKPGAQSSSRVSAQDSARAVIRLQGKGFRVTSPLTSDSVDCAADSYGRVQQFFRQHPCAGLHRALFEVRDKGGDVVLVAVAWVAMPDADRAADLKDLVDAPGTGNVTELSREWGRYQEVRFTGDFYDSELDGTVVVNAQAQPVARGPAGAVLTSIVTNTVR